MANITIENASKNYIYTSSGRTENTQGAVGYENSRFRVQRYQFSYTQPSGQNAISTFSMTWQTGSYEVMGGATPTIYWLLTTNGNLTTLPSTWTQSGSVTVTGSNPRPSIANTSVNIQQAAGTTVTYYLYIFTKSTTFGYRLWTDTDGYLGHRPYVTVTSVAYTKCGGVVSMTIPSPIVKNGYQISCSGATAGVLNPITGYDIYCEYNANSGSVAQCTTASTKLGHINTSATSFTATIVFPDTFNFDNKRGGFLRFGFVTVGTRSGYNSDMVNIQNPRRINRLPTISSVTTSNTRVPSGGGSITFTPSGSLNNDTGETLSYYYATSASGTKTKLSTAYVSLSITGTAGSTVNRYFWAYDGYEYSASYIQKGVVINIKPTIQYGTYQGSSTTVGTVTAQNGNGVSGYRLGWANTIRPVVTYTCLANSLMYADIEMSATGGATEQTTSFPRVVRTVDGVSIGATGGWILGTRNMDSFATQLYGSESTDYISNTGIKWRFKIWLNDGYENSEPAYYPSGGYFYTIPPAPTIVSGNNSMANQVITGSSWTSGISNITGTTAYHMYRQFSVILYKDTSLTNVNFNVKCGNYTIPQSGLTCTQTVSGNKVLLTFAIGSSITDSQLTPGAAMSIQAVMSNSNITKKTTITGSWIQAPIFTINNPSGVSTIPTIKPFTANSNHTVTWQWPFGTTQTIAEGLRNYECDYTNSGKDIGTIIRLVESNTNGVYALTAVSTPTISGHNWQYANQMLSVSFSTARYYPFDSNFAPLGFADSAGGYSGEENIKCMIRITNLYGRTWETGLRTGKLNFNEDITINSTTLQYYTKKNNLNQWLDIPSGRGVQEYMTIRMITSFTNYTHSSFFSQTYINTNTSGTYTTIGAQAQQTPLGTSWYSTNKTAGSGTITSAPIQVTKITTTNNGNYHFGQLLSFVSGTYNTSLLSSKAVEIPAIIWGDPLLTVHSYELLETGIKINYTYQGNGVTVPTTLAETVNIPITISLVDMSTTPETEIPLVDFSLPMGTNEITYQFSGTYTWDDESKPLAIRYRYRVMQTLGDSEAILYDTTIFNNLKIFYTPTVVVYNLQPTVAYRKNAIGINTKTVNSSAAVDIHSSQGRDLIRFEGKNAGGQITLFTMDVTTGTISYYVGGVLKGSINLGTGVIS